MFGDFSFPLLELEKTAVKGKGTFGNGPFGSDLLSSELTNCGVPVVYIRDIRNGHFTRKNNIFVTQKKADSLSSCHIVKGDILITKVGDPPGIAAIYPNDELAIMTQDVIRLRVSKNINGIYIQHWLNSKLGGHALKKIIVEGTKKRFSLKDFKKIKLPIPPFDLQNSFAGGVDEMTSNFSFLKKDPKYKKIAIACMETEEAIAISNSAAALQTRRALEIAVKFAYRYDSELEVPYQDNLSSLVHDHQFKEILDEKLFPRIRFIISLGNKAAHTAKPVSRIQAVESLRNLYDFISWIDFSYSTEIHNLPFNASLLKGVFEQEQKSRRIQEELAAKEAVWEAEREKLKEMLRSAEERREFTRKRKQAEQARDFVCDDISEFKTRKIYIDLALEMAGWSIGTDCLEEVTVQPPINLKYITLLHIAIFYSKMCIE